MGAIAGLVYWDGRTVDEITLQKMVDALAHRGPDGIHVWRSGQVGLGHCMLHTTPESLVERLPLTSADGRYTITADARIDNRDDLARALGLDSARARAMADSEYILAAYAAWGDACVEKLIGDFAFAVWDAEQHRLFGARDPMGVRALYYAQSERGFAFATEIRGVLALPAVPRRVNELRVAEHLTGFFGDRTRTFYQDVFALPAGHRFSVDSIGLRLERYWDLDPRYELKLSGDAAYEEAFRETFRQAVACRLRSAFPVGSFLSGGLDSSSITCMSREFLAAQGRDPIHTFSALFTELPDWARVQCDERPAIQAVLAGGGLCPHSVYADRLSPLEDRGRILWHEGEGTLGPNMYMHWALYKAARQAEVRVMLDGIDGDTAVSHGLQRFADLICRLQWITLAHEVRMLARRYDMPWHRVLREYGIAPLVPDGARAVWRKVRGKPPLKQENLARPDLLARALGGRVDDSGSRHGGWRELVGRGMHYHSIMNPLYQSALQMADHAASAFAVEPRYPFFDRRVLELCLSLPERQKLRDGWPRIVLRRALAGILPPEIQWRKHKAYLGWNFRLGLLGRERALLDDVILHRPEVVQEYVNISALQNLYEQYIQDPRQAPEANVIQIFNVVTLSLWLDDLSDH